MRSAYPGSSAKSVEDAAVEPSAGSAVESSACFAVESSAGCIAELTEDSVGLTAGYALVLDAGSVVGSDACPAAEPPQGFVAPVADIFGIWEGHFGSRSLLPVPD